VLGYNFYVLCTTFEPYAIRLIQCHWGIQYYFESRLLCQGPTTTLKWLIKPLHVLSRTRCDTDILAIKRWYVRLLQIGIACDLSNFKPRLNNDFIILCRLCFLRTFPCIRLIYLLHLVLSVWVAAVKCRPVLHHNSVVIFFWSGIMDCMLFTFENRVPLMLYELSVVWQLSLPMMNNFNKTEAAIFPCRLCFQRASPFIS